MPSPRVVSLTPAVFQLPDAVNEVSRHYGDAPIVPRGPAFSPLLAELRAGIVDVLEAPGYEAIVLTGSGSTAMAAVLGSCLHPGERLLVVRNGAYGDRLYDFARRLGQPLVDLAMPWGERPDLDRIERLCRDEAVDAITVVYGCTSTCALNPVGEIGAIAKRYGKKLLVDAVSALFIEPMDLAGWGVSAVMGSCNKGLHSHPNLTMALVRRDLLAEMTDIPQRVPSLELATVWKSQRAGAHPYTLDPMSVLQARAALGALRAEGGVVGRHERYARRAALLRAGYERLGLTIARWPGMPLQSIGTALELPASHGYAELSTRLATEPCEGHLFEIYAAQGKLSDRLFRVFHMGDYSLETYEIFLRSLGRVLA